MKTRIEVQRVSYVEVFDRRETVETWNGWVSVEPG